MSRLCTEPLSHSLALQEWCALVGERSGHMHRKVWEWGFICKALNEQGVLASPSKGLGFAVGEEPLSALFAARGVSVVATDLAIKDARRMGWADSGQHTHGLAMLNKRNLCDPGEFRERVRFEDCDMNHIRPEFNGRFDFVWSACALEHLGSIKLGQEFVYNAMDCLRPGGVAVHTTEYNVSSKTDTVDNEGTVIFRQCDLEPVIDALLCLGHDVEMDWNDDEESSDKFVNVPPYSHNPQLKLLLGQYVTTSISLVIRKRA
jgi:SAM-dependent methyltransferase